MAISIISSNLNQFGNAGNFETDPSTWGFDSSIIVSYDRAAGLYNTKGLYSCKSTILIGGTYSSGLSLATARFPAYTGKTYIAKAKFATASSPIALGAGTDVIKVKSLSSSTDIEEIATTVTAATDGSVDISLKFSVSTFNPLHLLAVVVVGTSINAGALSYTDQFEIYEYEDVEEPECDIAIDVAGTVVTDETTPGAGDGSITVAHTGTPRTTLEYSKDGGSIWQSSNVFSGLDDGIYNVVIRESGEISCNSAQSFSVNAGTAAFDFTTNVTNETVQGADNGRIEVTPSGSGSPFTYSKDGGSNYQSYNIFEDLPAATYVIVVKDSSGNTVTKNTTVAAGAVIFGKAYFSKNPIAYSRTQTSNSGEENYRIYNEVRTKIHEQSAPFEKKMANALEPDSLGNVTFNLRPAFRGLFAPSPPSLNLSSSRRLKDRSLNFKNYYGDIYDALTVPASFGNTTQDLIVLGGVDKRRFPDVDYFGDYLPTNKKFMTWAPKDRYIDKYQEDYLQYFVFDPTTITLKKKVKAYYDDDTNSTSTINTTTTTTLYGRIYLFPSGPNHGGALSIDPAKNLIKYEVWLEDQDDVIISEVMVYNVTKYTQPNTRYIMFLNSLGAHDVIKLTGKAATEGVIGKDIIEKHLDFNYSSLDGQYKATNSRRQEVIKYSSGFFSGKYGEYYAEYLQELLMSEQVYDITTGERVPITIEPGTFKMKQDDNNMYFTRFTGITAYQDEVFTPKTLPTLGA